MTQQELMIYLHQYTPWEMLHLKNLNNLQGIENLNQSLDIPVSESDKEIGLHLPHIPDSSNETFSENLFFSNETYQDILIVQHDRYTPPGLHKHDFFEFLYVYEGEFTQQIESTKLLMHTGDFCLIPPQVYHSLDICNYSIVLNILIPKSKFKNIIFNELQGNNILSTFFLENTYSRNINDYIIFHTNGDVKIQNIILDMCLETINKEIHYNHLLNTNLLLLLGLLLRNYEDTCDLPKIKKKKDSQNLEIMQYIENNYKTLTLQNLADRFHYSSQHISNRLKQLTGMSFTDYLLKKRMQAASNLLINTNIKIKSISEDIGYQSQEHFIRTFRKYYGVSPSAYRNTHQKPTDL